MKNIFELVGKNPQREGLLKTPARVFKSYEFLANGCKKDVKETLNDALSGSSSDGIVLVRDIGFYSLYEHHLLSFFGRAHTAHIPDKKVVGLSEIS